MLQELQKYPGVGVWLSPPNKIYDRGKVFYGRDYTSFMIYLAQYDCGNYYIVPDLSVLEDVIPMEQVWEGIKNDQAEIKFNQDVEEAMKMKDPRRVYIEKYGVDTNLACPTIIQKKVTLNGTVITGEKTYFVKNCGQCGVSIEKQIPAGYHCPNCGGIFEGCG